MIRDITLGQYYPGDSWVHRLDARTKIIATLLYLIELFVVNNFYGFLITAAVLEAVVFAVGWMTLPILSEKILLGVVLVLVAGAMFFSNGA